MPEWPLPPLEHLGQLLQWVKPLVDKEAYLETEQALGEFLKPKGEGERLRQKLTHLSQQNDSHWLAPHWNNQYLEYRGRLVGNMNYYVLFDNEQLKELYNLSTLSGSVIYHLTREYLDIIRGKLPTEEMQGQPLCMNQYEKMFKAVRIPQPIKDRYIVYGADDPQHVVIYHKSRLYKVNVTNQEGAQVPREALALAIQWIIDDLKNDEPLGEGDHDPGIFTTACRDEAALVYETVRCDPVNEKSLDVIQTAVFMVCIDPAPKDLQALQHSMLLSFGNNRYFDKSCQIILTENLDVGFNGEHTGVDGTPWFHLLSRVVAHLSEETWNAGPSLKVPLPEKLEWNLSDEAKGSLKSMMARHQAFSENLYMDHLIFNEFGKERIKEMHMSPDAFFHCALHLAQYKTFGKVGSTYESVSMRHFKQGRTECARSVHEETLRFVQAVCDEQCTTEVAKDLIMAAQRAHIHRIKQCQKGLGIERYLFVLHKMYEQHGEELGIFQLPALFESPGYKHLTHDFISTSNASNEAITLFGFGPVTRDGYGVGYVIKNRSIHVTLGANRECQQEGVQLLHNLKEALHGISQWY